MNKKLRNRILALVCLAIFVAVGGLFYTNWVVQKPFAIVLFLCDELTPSVLTPARNYVGGSDFRFEMEKLPHLALVTTHANDFAVSDAAAAASAVATGRKTNNRSLNRDAGREATLGLFDIARIHGRVTGLVTNASLTDPTAAAFYSRTADALDPQNLARQLFDNSDINLLLGGGGGDFLPDFKDGRRTDGRDLLLELRNKGFDIVRTQSELNSTPGWRAPRTLGVFSKDSMGFADEVAATVSQPSLAEMVSQAMRLLQYNPKGYLLVVDAGLAGKAASRNDAERLFREIAALDDAVAAAIASGGENALIIVAGKNVTGGLRLNSSPFRNDKGASILGINAQGVPSITWSTGPSTDPAQPAAFTSELALGTAEDVLALSKGPGSKELTGFCDNTDIFRLIQKGL